MALFECWRFKGILHYNWYLFQFSSFVAPYEVDVTKAVVWLISPEVLIVLEENYYPSKKDSVP